MSAQREAATAKAARRPAPSLAAPQVYPSLSQLSSAVHVPSFGASSVVVVVVVVVVVDGAGVTVLVNFQFGVAFHAAKLFPTATTVVLSA